MRKVRFLFCFISLLASVAIAQKKDKKQEKDERFKLSEKADNYLAIDEYDNALPLLLKLDSIQPGEGKTNYFIGLCYFKTAYKPKSLKYFLTARSKSYVNTDFDYYLGRSFHFNNRFDEAKTSYESYLSKLDTISIKENVAKYHEVKQYLYNCEIGRKLVADSLNVRIENIGPNINTKYPDYSPVVSADETELFFTSRRPGSTGGKIDDQDGYYFEDIYLSTHENGEWSLPRNMGDTINTNLHDACIGLSPDGHKLFIYRSDKSSKSTGHIYYSDLRGKSWSFPKKFLNESHSKTWEGSASITADEKTMYFSSDREGGYGGIDIYVVHKLESGAWGNPQNLGPIVNTSYDDDAPVIHADGKTLFFASRGHESMGGYDIFSTKFNPKDSSWTIPKNIGYPINTADDDIYFTYTADGSKGYFSSYRNDSYGEKDIYVVHRPDDSPQMIVLKGKVYDKSTGKPIPSILTIRDSVTGKIEGVLNSNLVSGKYSGISHWDKVYSITVNALGYLPHEYFIDMPEQSGEVFQVSRDYYLEVDTVYQRHIRDSLTALNNAASKVADEVSKEGIGEKIVVDKKKKRHFLSDIVENISMKRKLLKTGSFSLQNIQFEFNKSALNKSSFRKLNKLARILRKQPALYYEIAGHTDSSGPDWYNQKLSLARAKSVKEYLVSKGVETTRLEAKGYGESNPIATNSTRKGRQRNRRVEFIRKETIKP